MIKLRFKFPWLLAISFFTTHDKFSDPPIARFVVLNFHLRLLAPCLMSSDFRVVAFY